mgnify:CR=1 FL=1
MTKRLLLGLAVIVAAALVLTELVLPKVVGQMVAHGMKNIVASDRIVAQVSKHPSLAMLGGSFDTVDIAAYNAKLDKLTFKVLQLELTDVQLDRQRLLAHRDVSIQHVGGIDFSATLTEEELARYLNQSVKGIRNAQVEITPGQAKVTSSFSLGGIANVDITLDGKIVGEGQLIKFVTERLLINNNLIGSIGGNLLTNIPLVDLSKAPFGVSVRDIVMTDGLVIINADNRPH